MLLVLRPLAVTALLVVVEVTTGLKNTNVRLKAALLRPFKWQFRRCPIEPGSFKVTPSE